MIPSELDPDLNPDNPVHPFSTLQDLRRAADSRSFAHSAAAGRHLAVAGIDIFLMLFDTQHIQNRSKGLCLGALPSDLQQLASQRQGAASW